jgi:hypothetical protein
MSPSAWLLAACLAVPCRGDEAPSIQRSLAGLNLGAKMAAIQKAFPPLREWPSSTDPDGSLVRYTIDRSLAKRLPAEAASIRVGLRSGRLAFVQVLFAPSSRKSIEDLVLDHSMIYGEPRRQGQAFWWGDGRTLLRVSTVEVRVRERGRESVELRSSLELSDLR